MNDYQLVCESIIFNKKDLYYKFDEWVNGKNNMLLITGISRSGKTTLGKKLAKKYNCGYASMDDIDKDITKKYDDIRKKYDDPKQSELARNMFRKYAINFIKTHSNTKFIWEGVQAIYWLDNKEIANHSVIMMGTSELKAMYNGAKFAIKDKQNYPTDYKNADEWSLTRHMSDIFKGNKELRSSFKGLRKYLKMKDKN
jgi:adenylate kinase family enzyme